MNNELKHTEVCKGEQIENANSHEFGKEAEEYIAKLPSFMQQIAWNAFLEGASVAARKYKLCKEI